MSEGDMDLQGSHNTRVGFISPLLPVATGGFLHWNEPETNRSWVTHFKISKGDLHSMNRKSRERIVTLNHSVVMSLPPSYNIFDTQLDMLIADEAKTITVITVAQLLKLPHKEVCNKGKRRGENSRHWKTICEMLAKEQPPLPLNPHAFL